MTKPAYHCGAMECCEGTMYPECQGATSGPVSLRAPIVGAWESNSASTHYEDTGSTQAGYWHTD